MEPIQLFLGVSALTFIWDVWIKEDAIDDEVNKVKVVNMVSDIPVYEKGRFFKTPDGYYVSNLSSEKTIAIDIAGCDKSLLVGDLSGKGNKKLTEVFVECGG